MSIEANSDSNSTSIEYVPSEFDTNAEKPDKFDRLADRITTAETVADWSYILSDYITWGNRKIAKHVAVFNMNSATDCPNIGTDNCQVPKDDCYAYRAEVQYPYPLDYRRRQEYLWDSMDAETWARAFLEIVDRKHNEVSTIRFSQAGDFRTRGDIIKVDRIAEIVAEHDIDVYTYSASDYLDWSEAEHFTVNQSNNRREYGDKHYTAIPKDVDPEDVEFLDDNAVQCPYDYTDGKIKCGDCRLCIEPDAPDVTINQH